MIARLELVPVTLREANAFVIDLRRRIVGADDFLALTRSYGRSVREGPTR